MIDRALLFAAFAELNDDTPPGYHDMADPATLGRARFVAGDPISLNPYFPALPGEDGEWWSMRAGWKAAAAEAGALPAVDDAADYAAALDALEEYYGSTHRAAELQALREARGA